MRKIVYKGSPQEIAEYEQLKAQGKVNRRAQGSEQGDFIVNAGAQDKPSEVLKRSVINTLTGEEKVIFPVQKADYKGTKRKVGGRSCKRWTDEELSTLHVLTAQGLPIAKIAKILTRTETSISVQQKTMGNRAEKANERMQARVKKPHHSRIVNSEERARMKYISARGNAYIKSGMSRSAAWQRAADEWHAMHPKQ
jgi:hypothetical protein